MRWWVVLPAVVLIALVGLLGYGLTRNPRILPSALIDKPAPAFALPTLANAQNTISKNKLRGHVALVNVWASWCVACRSEVGVIGEISQRTGVPVIGLDWKDSRDEAKRWLKTFGNPFAVVAFDKAGTTGIDFGVTGVPETFIIDANGVIRYKVVGPVTPKKMRDHVIPTLKKLQGET